MTGWGGAPVPGAAVAAAASAARGYARLAGGAEDALLEQVAGSALAVSEAFLGQALIVRGFTDRLAGDGGWHMLSTSPVVAVTGVTDGDGQVLPVEAYAVDIGADGRGWVRSRAAVEVSYLAGLATDWDALPPPLALGVAMLAAHLFDAGAGAPPPAAVSALWRPWRRMRL